MSRPPRHPQQLALGEPQPVNTGDELPAGDYLTWTCSVVIGPGLQCNTVTQGGRRGLALHMAVVHPDRPR